MFLHALATANPPRSFAQKECYEIAKSPAVRERLNRRSQLFAQAILRGDSGSDARQFAVEDMPGVFGYSADQLNEAFRREAPILASAALTKVLDQPGLAPRDLDALL